MKKLWIIALLLPVGTTLAFWSVLPSAYRVGESSDFDTFYKPVAEAVLAGRGLTVADGSAALRYPPGFPIILAGTLGAGRSIGASDGRSLIAMTLVCVALSSLFLFLIADDLWGGSLALVPSAVWSTYPLALWLTKQPNSEVPFTVLLFGTVLVVWKLLRGSNSGIGLAALAGIIGGAAMLVRPIALLLPLVLAALVLRLAGSWALRRRIIAATTIIAVSVLAVAQWEVHAAAASGQLVLLGTGGVPSVRDGLTFGVNPEKSYRSGIYVPDFVRTVMIGFYSHYSELDSYGAVAQVGAQQLKEHPVGMAGLASLKLIRAWYGTDSQRLDKYILLLQLGYLTVLVRASWLARRAGGERRRLYQLCAGILVYFWAMSVLALPLVRYMLPAIGLAFLLVPVVFESHTHGRISAGGRPNR